MSSYLAEQFGGILIATQYYFWHRRYLSLKFSCDEIIETIGLILQRNMFSVTIVLFLLLISANELIVSNKDLLKVSMEY